MRSRYSAYVLGCGDYLLATWHSSSRPATIDVTHAPRWLGLTVHAATGGGEGDTEGTVEFVAHWQEGARRGALHETSRFRREAGVWRYLDGVIHPETRSKVGRNDPCPCGSGRKFKQCCGR